MQNNSLVLNNIFLEEVIRAKLLDTQKSTNNIITETMYTTGMFDLATVDGTMIGWTEQKGQPWKNYLDVNVLKSLGAQPFACSKDKQFFNPVDKQNFVAGKYKGLTDIGYQVLIYSKEIGTLLRFYKDGSMTAAGMGDNIWGWKNQGNKIYLFHKTLAYKNELNWQEGYLNFSGGRLIFVDTRKPGLKTSAEQTKEELRKVFQYAAEHNYVYGGKEKPGYWQRALDRLQTGFDWVGIIFPPVDVVNAALYIIRDRYLEAVFSIVALIPGVGDVFNILGKSIIKAFGITGRFIGQTAVYFWKALLNKFGKKMAPVLAQQIAAKLLSTKQLLKKLQQSGMSGMTEAQYKEYAKIMDEQLESMKTAVKELSDEGTLSLTKVGARKQVAKKLGGEYAEFAATLAQDKAPEWLRKGLSRAFLKGGTKLIKGMFRSADSAVLAVFNKMLRMFLEQTLRHPKALALTMVSFADKTLMKNIVREVLGADATIRGGKGIFETMAKSKTMSKWFVMSKEIGLMGAYKIESINPKYMAEFLTHLFNMKSGKVIYQKFASAVYQKIAKGVPNYYWDLFKTNPFREVAAKLTNPLQRFGTAYWTNGLAFAPRIGDVVTSTSLWKKADIIYNEWVKNREIKAGFPDLSKNSVLCALLYKAGVYRMMDKAQQNLMDNKDYRWIQSRIGKNDVKDQTPYEIPGATDSTTFQNWSKDTDPKIKARYVAASKKNQDAIDIAKKQLSRYSPKKK